MLPESVWYGCIKQPNIMIPDTLRFLKHLATPSPAVTILPGRWRNVGTGRTDVPIPDPAYSKPKEATVRRDIVRLFTNEAM